MAADPFARALILTGPTGSGKSSLALELAPRLGAEIVCMDSMTVYRGMDVGTAKPSAGDRARVPHHLLDERDPSESASVAWWLDRAARHVADIESRGARALLVGGTALYLKAVLCGLFDGPPADAGLRAALEEEARAGGPTALHERLRAADPASADRLHPNDVRRVVRALEVWTLTGRPLSDWQTQWLVEPAGVTPEGLPRVLCLDLPRPELHERINRRVLAMFEQGLVAEVERLRSLDPGPSREAWQALGYREVRDYLEGRATRSATVATLQARTRQFAKRQLTWFRHLPAVRMVTGELTTTLWESRIVQGVG